jgi:tetratricopeptide (TPR) repeat protein
VAGSIKSYAARCGVVAVLLLGAQDPILFAAPVEPNTDLHAIILTPPVGGTTVDTEIRRLQEKIGILPEANPLIVQLGWAFVAKARLTSDPGYYKLAEQCSELTSQDSDSLLLKGHIFHALHRFKEAEEAARQLTADDTSRWQYFALLGDALMEQGKLAQAIDAYQRMIDLRPCLQTYVRVAHLRWLKGDLAGAEELMVKAVEAGNSRDPEPAAWSYTRLALYQFQAGKNEGASLSLNRAMEFVRDYPAALLLQGKIDLVKQEPAKAVECFRRAAEQSPLPEYEWALADAAQLTGNDELARKTEEKLVSRGAAEDPRTLSLFLATRKEDAEKAAKLAATELSNRRDVFSYDAMAWTALASGQTKEAAENMDRALAEGTIDARLFYHAGKVAFASGRKGEADKFFKRAAEIKQLLLPSEQSDLMAQSTAQRSSGDAAGKLSSTNQETGRNRPN